MSTTLTYSLASDFPNNIIDSSSLIQEITDDDATVGSYINYIDVNNDEVRIYFTQTLTAPQISGVDDVVDNHQGDPMADDDTVEAVNAFEESNASIYKTLAYSNGIVSEVKIYSDSGLTQLIYTKTLSYTTGTLSSVTLVDELGNLTYKKDLDYTTGSLSSVNVYKT